MKKSLILPAILAIAALILTSCAGSGSPGEFSYGDISFSHPSDWAVTDTEEYGYSVFISAEKKGLNSSGIVMFTIVDGSEDIY